MMMCHRIAGAGRKRRTNRISRSTFVIMMLLGFILRLATIMMSSKDDTIARVAATLRRMRCCPSAAAVLRRNRMMLPHPLTGSSNGWQMVITADHSRCLADLHRWWTITDEIVGACARVARAVPSSSADVVQAARDAVSRQLWQHMITRILKILSQKWIYFFFFLVIFCISSEKDAKCSSFMFT